MATHAGTQPPDHAKKDRDEGVASSALSAEDPFHGLRVLVAYREHQPRWNAGRMVCTCGRLWGEFCPRLAARLAELGHDPAEDLHAGTAVA